MGGLERGRGTVVSRSGDETNDETTDPATEDGDARARRARAARAFVALAVTRAGASAADVIDIDIDISTCRGSVRCEATPRRDLVLSEVHRLLFFPSRAAVSE
jgi:hypothetical protein